MGTIQKSEATKVTQNDVAKAAGVTRSMVSYVISGRTDRSVAPETRQRILEVIDQLGYRPNKAAQALQQGDVAFAAKKIGVVLANAEMFRRPYYAEILAGIHTAAHELNHYVSFIRFFHELKDPVLFNELIHNEEIGGLILVSLDQSIKTKEDKIIIEKIKERIPQIVCIEWKSENLTSVMFNRQEAAYKACEFAFSKGYKHLAYIGLDDERVFGVQQFLLQHEQKSSIKEFFLSKAFDMWGGYDAIKEVIEQNKLPRAIICGSDEVAIGVICYLNQQKISIPNEVAVVSIDNIEMSGYTYPPLTTINVQKSAMGYQAVEMIVRGNAKNSENAVCVMLPTSIIERQTC